MPRPSPLQNRCAPDGTLHAVAARGLFMGNRGGRLHGPDRRLGAARWRGRAWICCRIDFRDRKREVMGAGYTEIFFLDEATALAAGHRPCFECRRADAQAFAAAWARARDLARPPKAPEMDRILHAERRATFETCRLRDLPDGSIFATGGGFRLKLDHEIHAWDFDGYRPVETETDPDGAVAAVTPPAVRAALSAGYRPRLHPSARLRS
ncbi:MAG: hypothetical protein H6896_14335 [Rhodovulum sp.]|nr:hypothetical protein [Rhodovulum sp.]